jgi:hypothetical protein
MILGSLHWSRPPGEFGAKKFRFESQLAEISSLKLHREPPNGAPLADKMASVGGTFALFEFNSSNALI